MAQQSSGFIISTLAELHDHALGISGVIGHKYHQSFIFINQSARQLELSPDRIALQFGGINE
jgi:hypothetical protein